MTRKGELISGLHNVGFFSISGQDLNSPMNTKQETKEVLRNYEENGLMFEDKKLKVVIPAYLNEGTDESGGGAGGG